VPKGGKLPPEVIKDWPEIFKDIDIYAVPVKYITSLRVQFDDGEIWEIDVKNDDLSEDEIEDTIESFFEEYDEVIESVDFRLDTRKVIKDIRNRTRLFMKKRK
jgi:hypothetical protein